MTWIHGGRAVAQALHAEGVSHVFTLCGGHIQNIYDGCLDVGIRVVDTRHEQTAAHAADGWARATGKPGVCLVTAGPGVTDAVTGVANAFRAQVPMLVIGGAGPRFFKDMGSLQDMNHVDLMRPITKWSATVTEPRRVREYVQTAFRIATTGVPGPVFLEMPLDILLDAVDPNELVHYPHYRSESRPAPDARAIDAAAALLRTATRPMLIVGTQWWWSSDRDGLHDFLRVLPIPTYLNGMARGALPPDHPCLCVHSRGKALEQADVVVILGTPLDFRINYGRAPKVAAGAKLIQVDLDPTELGRNRGPEVGIHADSGQTLRALAAALAGHAPAVGAWRDAMRAADGLQWQRMAAEMQSDDAPVNPLRACAELAALLDDRAIVVGDGGDFLATAAKIVMMRRPGSWMDPGPLGTLGVGPGYAMAAKLARPDAQVFIIYGDGSFGLHGMEFEAMARQKIKVVGVIGNDAAWMQIRRGQVAFFGPERAVATALDYTRYDLMAQALGCHGEYVERPADLRPALERAIASPLPALVNIKISQSDFRRDAISV